MRREVTILMALLISDEMPITWPAFAHVPNTFRISNKIACSTTRH